jgi:hypothetical protein
MANEQTQHTGFDFVYEQPPPPSAALSSAPNQAPAVTRFGGDQNLVQGRPDPLVVVARFLGDAQPVIGMLDKAIDKNDRRKRHEAAATLVRLMLLSFEYLKPEIKMQLMDILMSTG